MKSSIRARDYEQIKVLKARADNLTRQQDRIVDQVASIFDEHEEEIPNGFAFNLILNCKADELDSELARFGIEVKK